MTSNRALRELVAEAKAEVMEEIEDSRDEAEEDDSSESASVSAPNSMLASLAGWLWWGKEPSNSSRLQKVGLQLCWAPLGVGGNSCLAREELVLVAVKGMEKQ